MSAEIQAHILQEAGGFTNDSALTTTLTPESSYVPPAEEIIRNREILIDQGNIRRVSAVNTRWGRKLAWHYIRSDQPSLPGFEEIIDINEAEPIGQNEEDGYLRLNGEERPIREYRWGESFNLGTIEGPLALQQERDEHYPSFLKKHFTFANSRGNTNPAVIGGISLRPADLHHHNRNVDLPAGEIPTNIKITERGSFEPADPNEGPISLLAGFRGKIATLSQLELSLSYEGDTYKAVMGDAYNVDPENASADMLVAKWLKVSPDPELERTPLPENEFVRELIANDKTELFKPYAYEPRLVDDLLFPNDPSVLEKIQFSVNLRDQSPKPLTAV